MYQLLNKYGQAAAFGLGVLITVIFFLQITSGIETFEGLSKEEKLQSGIFSSGLYAAIGLAILCITAILLFGIHYIATNPKSALKGMLPFLAIVVVFIISYAMAVPAIEGPMAALVERFGLTDGQEKLVTAGLSTTGILFLIASASFIFFEIRNFFK